MPNGILVAGGLFVVVLLGCIIVLYADARQKRLLRQLEVAALSPEAPAAAPRSIRRQRSRGGLGRAVFLLFRFDAEAPRPWPAWRVVMVGVLAATAALVGARAALPLWLAPIVGLVTGVAVVRGLFGWLQDRYADRLLRQLPDTIELVVSAVRAGLPVAEAFRGVANEMPEPTREQFAHVVSELALGRPIDEALLNLNRRTGVREYAMFATTLAVQAKSGGRLAETIQGLGETVRQRIAVAGRAKALAAEAKLSAQILASLPVLTGLAQAFLRPGYMNPLLDDPRGRKLLAYGVASLLVGIATMHRLVKKGTSV